MRNHLIGLCIQAERRRAELVERAEKKETELTWDDEGCSVWRRSYPALRTIIIRP